MLSKVTIKYFGKNVETIYDALYISQIFAYSILDKKDFLNIIESENNWDYIDNNWLKDKDYIEIDIILEKDIVEKKIYDFRQTLRQLDFDLETLNILIEDFEDFDWHSKWKEFYSIIEIGKVQIIPIWEKEIFIASKIPVYINPSIAFGTGEHESTKICIDFLSNINVHGSVLDIGTGSGILGITAKKLGAKKVDLIDVDYNALENTKENVLLNNLLDNMNIYQSSFLDKVSGKFDLIISNMTADLNLELLMDLPRICKDKCDVVLSGILLDKKEKVVKNYSDLGFKLISDIQIGEWVGLHLKYRVE